MTSYLRKHKYFTWRLEDELPNWVKEQRYQGTSGRNEMLVWMRAVIKLKRVLQIRGKGHVLKLFSSRDGIKLRIHFYRDPRSFRSKWALKHVLRK